MNTANKRAEKREKWNGEWLEIEVEWEEICNQTWLFSFFGVAAAANGDASFNVFKNTDDDSEVALVAVGLLVNW